MEDSSHLPLYSRRPGPTRQPPRRDTPISQPRSSSSQTHKCVHVIPLLLLLSFSILWWFSYPVNLVNKDGRIVEIVPIEIPNEMLPALNDTDVELAILKSAVSPFASTPLNFTGNINEIELLQMSKSN